MEWFWIALTSAVLSAAAAVIQKKVLFSLPALNFSFFLSFAVLFLSAWIPFSVPLGHISLSAFLLLVVKSLLGAIAFLLVMMALEKNEISSALPLLGVTPASTAFLAFVLLGEHLQPLEWVGIGLMIGGTFLIEKRPHMNLWESIRSSRTQAVIAGAVAFFTLSALADRVLLTRLQLHPQSILFFQHLVSTLLFGGIFFMKRSSHKMVAPQQRLLIGMLIVLIAMLTLGYRYTQLEATKIAPVALVLAVKRLSILFASFVGGKFFAEERLAIKLAGAVCIVAGGFFILRHIS